MNSSNNSENAINAQDDEMSLKELLLKLQEWWTYLLAKWYIILIAGIIGGVIGLAYAKSKITVYTAELSFALEDEKSGGLGGAAGIASQFGIDLGGNGGGAFSGDNLMELMKSRSMVEKALLTEVNVKGKKVTLAELYISFNKLREVWANNPELKNIKFLSGADRSTYSIQQDSILGGFYRTIIQNNLTVDKKDKKLSIILVKVVSTNELFAKLFTEVITKVVADFYIDTKTKKSVQNLKILQHQTDSVRRALNGAMTGVASSFDANPNANPSRQVLRVPSQSRQVDVQANSAILNELVKNLEISKVSLRKETPLIQIIDSPILPLDRIAFSKSKGIAIGGLIGGFLIIIFFIVKKLLQDATE